MAPFLIGRDVDRIEEIFQMSCERLLAKWTCAEQCQCVDQALWDIKGKRAGMPIPVVRGKCREAAACYVHEG